MRHGVVFEGKKVHPCRKLAITMLAPWHLSVNAGVWVRVWVWVSV